MAILWNVLNVSTSHFLKFQAFYWVDSGFTKRAIYVQIMTGAFIQTWIYSNIYLGASEPYFKINLMGAEPKEMPD